MHPILARQLRRLGLDEASPPSDVETWQKLLKRLDASYNDADDNRYLLERSLHVSSQEMSELQERTKERSERAQARVMDHYQHLFSRVPVALWTQDYTDVVGRLDAMRVRGVRDLRSHLTENHDELVQLVKLIRVVDVNAKAVALNGVEREVLLGPIKAEMLDDQSIRSFMGHLEALWHGQTSTHYSFSSTTFSGARLEALFYWLVETRDGEPDYANVLVTIIDITTLKETEERLARQIQSKDRFLASVSHELRTPLTGVYAGAETLRDQWDDLPSGLALELVETIARESGELAAMIDDLLVAARSEIGDVHLAPALTNVGDLVGAVLTVLRPEDSGKSVDVDVGDLVVYGDPLRIRQIVRNLVTNAVRYGGETVKVVGASIGDRRFITVEDDGPGVPPEPPRVDLHPV